MATAILTMDEVAGDRSPGRLLVRINKLLLKRIEQRFAGADLSFSQWISLKLLIDGVVTTAGELAREVGITTGANTRFIDGLEAQGLVERDRSTQDRRVVYLKITDLGRTKYLERASVMLSSWNGLLEQFDKSEVVQLVQLLTKLLHAFERHSGESVEDPA